MRSMSFSRGNQRFPRDSIGVPRFELGTSPTRTERATRLRHTPSGDRLAPEELPQALSKRKVRVPFCAGLTLCLLPSPSAVAGAPRAVLGLPVDGAHEFIFTFGRRRSQAAAPETHAPVDA